MTPENSKMTQKTLAARLTRPTLIEEVNVRASWMVQNQVSHENVTSGVYSQNALVHWTHGTWMYRALAELL